MNSKPFTIFDDGSMEHLMIKYDNGACPLSYTVQSTNSLKRQKKNKVYKRIRQARSTEHGAPSTEHRTHSTYCVKRKRIEITIKLSHKLWIFTFFLFIFNMSPCLTWPLSLYCTHGEFSMWEMSKEMKPIQKAANKNHESGVWIGSVQFVRYIVCSSGEIFNENINKNTKASLCDCEPTAFCFFFLQIQTVNVTISYKNPS